MWLDPEEMSKWAYYYCRYKEDKPEIRKLITDSQWAYFYCSWVKDDPEVRKNITDYEWASRYCHYVKDRPEVRKYKRRKNVVRSKRIV